MASEHLTFFTDGASRGNPGPAAVSYVIQRDGEPDLTYGDTIGLNTNNFAEYTAMIRALAAAKQLRPKSIRLHSDSELMVKQLRGEYRVKHPDIQTLYQEAQELIDAFPRVEFVHIPRWQNAQADQLCNDALDGRMSATHQAVTNDSELPPTSTPETADILQLLSSIRAQWARGTGPEVEAVWEQLLALLKRHKMLKTRRTKSSR
jgi:ribonuclease HI